MAGEGDTILGSAKMGPNRAGRGSHVATASFMVDPTQAGRGVGRALGEHVLAWARSAGYRSMQFNAVVETNTGAVHLWRSLGIQILTTIPEAFDHHEHGLVGLHIMFRNLLKAKTQTTRCSGRRPADEPAAGEIPRWVQRTSPTTVFKCREVTFGLLR